MTIVIKFGGTSVATVDRINAAARKIKSVRKSGDVLVVVSAMGNQTSELFHLLKGVDNRIRDISKVSEVIGIGEIISARLMALALDRIGVRAKAITPDMAEWPIFAQAIDMKIIASDKINQEGLAVIDLARTADACSRTLKPLLKKGVVPVVCGFLARDEDHKLIVIGRGGSDITATLLGRCVRADKIIIVTDVPGVLAGDPKLVRIPKQLKKITVKEIEHLARGGARVIHPAALLYKLPAQRVVVVDYKSRNLNRGGTEILGNVAADVRQTEVDLAFLTVVGEKFLQTTGLILKIARKLSEKRVSIYGLSISENYIGLYVAEKSADLSYNEIFKITHAEPRFRAVSIRKGVSRLCITSPNFIEEPGIIGRIGDLLADHGINILEMNTIQSDITVFLNKSDAKKAFALLRSFKFP